MFLEGESTSPPVNLRLWASSAVSTKRVPSEKTRAVVLLITPLIPEILPIMSLLITALTRQPSLLAIPAIIFPPNSPCSSPDNAA